MALAIQKKTFALGVGMDESIARELLQPDKALKMQRNARFVANGRANKRLGYQTLDQTNIETGGTISKGYRLLVRGNELCLVDGHYLYSFLESQGKWSLRDRVPEALMDIVPVASDWVAGKLDWPAVAYRSVAGGKLACVVFCDINTNTIFARTLEITAGEWRLINEEPLSTAGARPRVYAIGTHFLAIWADTGATRLQVKRLDTAAPAAGWSAGVNVVTDVVDTQMWDAVANVSSTQLSVVWIRTGGGGQVDLRQISEAIATDDTELDLRAGKVSTRPSVFEEGAVTYVAFRNVTDSTVEVIGKVTSGLGVQFAVQVIATGVTTGNTVHVGKQQASKAWVCWDTIKAAGAATGNCPQSAVNWRGVSTAGAVDAQAHISHNVRMASRIWFYDLHSYMLFETGQNQEEQRGLCVVDLGNDYLATAAYRARPIGKFANGELYNTLADMHLGSVTQTADSSFLFAYAVKDFGTANASRGVGVNVATFEFDDLGGLSSPYTRWSSYVEIGGELIGAAALPWVYDGERVFEAGFTFYPWVEFSELVGGGSLTADNVYQYRVVYAYQDRGGRIWRSTPSNVRSATPTGANLSVRLYIPHYSITAMVDSDADQHPVAIEVYRRNVTAGGAQAPFQRLVVNSTTRVLSKSDPLDTDYFEFLDTGLSAADEPFLYTDGANGADTGVLAAVIPPPLTGVCLFDGRVFGHDRRRVWYTREIVTAEGPAWHEGQTLLLEAKQITAICPLDAYLLVFEREAIWWTQGTGPDDQGIGSSYLPFRRVPSQNGCTDSRCLLAWKQGVLFRSRLGVAQLDRGLNVSEFSDPVFETIESFPVLKDIVEVPDERELRIIAESSDSETGRFLVYNYEYGYWTVHDVFAESEYSAVSAVLVQNSYTWLHTSGTTVTQSNDWIDLRGDGTKEWITQGWETGDIEPDGPLGVVKIHRASVLGRKMGDHGLVVQAAANQLDALDAARTYTAAEVSAFAGLPLEVVGILPQSGRQIEGRSIRYKVEDAESTVTTPSEGVAWIALVIEFSVESGSPRVPSGQAK